MREEWYSPLRVSFLQFVFGCFQDLACVSVFVAGACILRLFLPVHLFSMPVFTSVCDCVCVYLCSASFPLCLLVNVGI